MSNVIKSGASADLLSIDANKNAHVKSPGYDATGNQYGGGNDNANAMFSENDPGTVTGSRYTMSPETDNDFRLRVAADFPLDDETFYYAAQNTGKHQYHNTTMTITQNAAGLLTNASGITTTNTGVSYRTYAMFPQIGSGQTLYCQFSAAFSNQPVANCAIDIGLVQMPTTAPFVPTDGVFIRIDSSGVKGVTNNNTSETETLLNFTYTNNRSYRFVIASSESQVCFYIDDVLYAKVPVRTGQGSPFLSPGIPFALRQAHVGGAGGVVQMLVKDYSISMGGFSFSESLGQRGNAIFGSYQGLSGGTMGTIGTYTNSTNPTAAVPTNTTNATGANGLLTQSWETFSLAVNTDGILLSYPVPAGTVSVPGKRLKVVGVKLSSFVQSILSGGPCIRTFALAFGHTQVSIAATESATAKARRIVLLPELTQAITVNQAVSTMISQPGGSVSMFPEPIYVNPGEFVAVTEKIIGTVGTSGTIVNHIQLIYSWE